MENGVLKIKRVQSVVPIRKLFELARKRIGFE